MQDNKLINFKKKLVLKHITKDGNCIVRTFGEKESNSEELNLKNVELYKPYTYEQLLCLNKKKYRNLKIEQLKDKMFSSLWLLEECIELYKELINRTEFWEKRTTYEFNFNDWNTLKKANGKLTRYYNDIKKIYQKIEMEEK